MGFQPVSRNAQLLKTRKFMTFIENGNLKKNNQNTHKVNNLKTPKETKETKICARTFRHF
jgi:hypothetical protein